MRVIEAAVEARKVHVLQQDTWETSAKTYSFPVDSHLSQLTIQVTNYKTQDPIRVGIRNPEGRLRETSICSRMYLRAHMMLLKCVWLTRHQILIN